MANNTLNVWLIELRDTEANLTSNWDASTAAKTLSAGRLAFVTDSDKIGWFKVGDGTTSFANLPYNTATPVSHEHSASDITSGTLDTARIPNLNTSKLTAGTLGVARGGTGKATHTTNAVLTGNGTSAVNNVPTKNGAAYATSDNGALTFGTLPVGQGGTGATTLTSDKILQGNGTSAIKSTLSVDKVNSTSGIVNTSSDAHIPTSAAVAKYVEKQMAGIVDAVVYKGTVSAYSSLPTSGAKVGWSYKTTGAVSIPAANSATGSAVTTDNNGDTIILKEITTSGSTVTYKWDVIPSGDDVMSITAGAGLRTVKSTDVPKVDGGTINSSGTLQLTELFDSDPGAKGPTANVTGTNNSTIKVPSVTVDKYGRVTAITEYTLTNKDTAHPTYNPESTTSTASPAHGGTFTAIDSLTITNGHVTGINTKTITLPGDQDHDVKATQTKLADTNSNTYDVILSNATSGGNTETAGVNKNPRLNFAPKDVTNATIQNSNNKDEGTLIVGPSGTGGTGRIKAKLNTNFLDQASGDVLILNGNI